MAPPDTIEELLVYNISPLGSKNHTLRFIRAAGNSVMLFLGEDVVAVLNVEQQSRLALWLARRVEESQ
jgi:hypothetical protein